MFFQGWTYRRGNVTEKINSMEELFQLVTDMKRENTILKMPECAVLVCYNLYILHFNRKVSFDTEGNCASALPFVLASMCLNWSPSALARVSS